MIEIKNISKIYNKDVFEKEKIAVKKLSFTVNKGEVFGFLGPNGSGKTTMIKMMLGLTLPTSGEILLNKQNPFSTKIKHSIGYLPENPYFYSHLTGVEVLEFVANLFGIPKEKQKKKINDLLKKVKMYHAKNKFLRTYSKGMLQRIGIAQALTNDPEILFLDEPMSGLDPLGRKEVKEIILELKRSDKTVFFCSHILEDAQSLCDRVGIIVDGNLVACDNVSKFIQNNTLEGEFIRLVEEERFKKT